MKNLTLWDVGVKNLKIDSKEKLFISYGHDEANAGELYVCSPNLVVRSFGENGEENWSKDLSETASSENRPVNITFLTLPNALCVGLENGELFTIGDSGSSYDLAGVCDSGLLV